MLRTIGVGAGAATGSGAGSAAMAERTASTAAAPTLAGFALAGLMLASLVLADLARVDLAAAGLTLLVLVAVAVPARAVFARGVFSASGFPADAFALAALALVGEAPFFAGFAAGRATARTVFFAAAVFAGFAFAAFRVVDLAKRCSFKAAPFITLACFGNACGGFALRTHSQVSRNKPVRENRKAHRKFRCAFPSNSLVLALRRQEKFSRTYQATPAR
jgi:hypothetical protein